MARFNKFAVALAAAPILAISGTVFAGSPGQLAQGVGLYQVKNITQAGSYASTISASCNDEVVYSMELANTGFGDLNNVTLTASFPSGGGTSTATATTDLGGNSGTHDSVTVNIGSGKTISYEAGTSVLYNGSGSAIRTLSDGVTGSGINVGTITGSTTEFVNFRAKVNCATPTPTQKQRQSQKQTVVINNAAKPLPNTGPGDMAEIFAGSSALGAAGRYLVLRRRQ